ncbi:MAG: helix-turn-helix transcriptional regulator [Bdellovibrionota bacterium]
MGDKEYSLVLKDLSKKIKSLREKKGLTQEKMKDFGFNYRHYQKLESGTYSPSFYTLFRLAKAFKVSLKDFF